MKSSHEYNYSLLAEPYPPEQEFRKFD